MNKILPPLVLLAALGPLGLNMPMPSLPLLAQELNTTAEKVQLTLTAYLVGMGLSQIIMGPLSDKYGRRPMIMLGLAIGLVGCVLAIIAGSIEAMGFARLLQAFGLTSGIVLGRAMIRDLYSQNEAAAMIGWVTMAMMVAPMIAPGLGGYLGQHYGFAVLFSVLFVFSLMTSVVSYYTIPETRPQHTRQQGFFDYVKQGISLFKIRDFVGYSFTGGFSSISFFAFLGAAPYVVVQMMGVTPAEYGLWFSFTAFGYMAGNFMSGKYSVSKGSAWLINWGVVLSILGAALGLLFWGMGLMTKPLYLFLPHTLIVFANGMMLPSAMAGALSVRPQIAGSAAGINGFSHMMMGAVGAQFTGYYVTKHESVFPMLVFLFVSTLLAGAAFRLVGKEKGLS